MPKPKVKVGDELRVIFWDHGENSKDALLFKVYGEVMDITRLAYKVRSWAYVNDVDRAGDGNPENEVHFTIVKRAIEDIKVFK